MTPNEVIADLVKADGGLAVLDKLYLPYPHAPETGGPAVKFGLGAELYLSEVDRSQLRDRANQFLVDFAHTFPHCVDRFLPREQKRTVKFKGDPADLIRRDSEKYPPETGYSVSLFGAVESGLVNDDIEPYQAHTLILRSSDHRLSFVSAQSPVCSSNGKPYFETLLAAVLRWATLCQPIHGSAGYVLTFAAGMEQNTIYALPVMKRFPGFDLLDGVAFVGEAETTHHRIKSVNWLTILGDTLVEELGGLDPMRSALEPVCKVHAYPGGVVIQAGEAPLLGDTWENNFPEAYRLVARYTRSIRFEEYDEGLFRVPDNLNGIEETLAWVRRFD